MNYILQFGLTARLVACEAQLDYGIAVANNEIGLLLKRSGASPDYASTTELPDATTSICFTATTTVSRRRFVAGYSPYRCASPAH